MRHIKGVRLHFRLIYALAAVFLVPGCATTENVRYVYQDRDFGVIGMPENTDEWPTHYRRQAEKLMEQHFPEGHEIVRAEEVVEGSRVLKIEGSKTAELIPQLPTELLKVAKIGGTSSRSQADTLSIKECRIIYRRIPPIEADRAEVVAPANPKPRARIGNRPGRIETADFAEQAAATPAQYLDPNAAERRKAQAAAPAAATAQTETSTAVERHVVAKPAPASAPGAAR